MNISAEYSHPHDQQPKFKQWYKMKESEKINAVSVPEADGAEYHDNMRSHHILTLKRLTKDDSAKYIFRCIDMTHEVKPRWSDVHAVSLVVTGNLLE